MLSKINLRFYTLANDIDFDLSSTLITNIKTNTKRIIVNPKNIQLFNLLTRQIHYDLTVDDEPYVIQEHDINQLSLTIKSPSDQLNTYRVPLLYQMATTISIKAKNKDDLLKKLDRLNFTSLINQTHSQLLKDSIEIDYNSLQSINHFDQ